MAQPAVAATERRLFERFDLMAQVRVKRGKIDILMELTNISMSGALVCMGTLRAPSWVEEGRVVEIGIVHPGDLDTITVRGEIVRIQKVAGATKFAVQFVDVDDQTIAGLERLHVAAVEAAALEGARPRERKVPPPLPKTSA